MTGLNVNPLVSVIIPCYNHGRYIHQCLESVKGQTYKNIEIIIVNDGSTEEETGKILSEINELRTTVLNKENAGLAAARNTGIDHSVGEIILPIDADDHLGDTYIEKAVAILKNDPETGLVSCRGEYFGTRTGIPDNKYVSADAMMLYNSLFHCAIFRKADFLHIGKYNPNMTKGYEDWEMYIRMLQYKEKVVQLPDILFFYRQRHDSMLHTLEKSKADRIEMENVLFKNNIEHYMNRYGSMIQVLREYEELKRSFQSADDARQVVYNTASYRLGDLLLKPFKLIKKALKNK